MTVMGTDPCRGFGSFRPWQGKFCNYAVLPLFDKYTKFQADMFYLFVKLRYDFHILSDSRKENIDICKNI